jgi:hypothetical protein
MPAFSFEAFTGAFIWRSQNKVGGTVNVPEHRAFPFVVVRAMQTREETVDD